MCLSVPAQIISIDGENAIVSVGGATANASLRLIDDAQVGDYILLHSGFALQKISEEEAQETLKVFEEFRELNDELDQEEKESGQRIV